LRQALSRYSAAPNPRRQQTRLHESRASLAACWPASQTRVYRRSGKDNPHSDRNREKDSRSRCATARSGRRSSSRRALPSTRTAAEGLPAQFTDWRRCVRETKESLLGATLDPLAHRLPLGSLHSRLRNGSQHPAGMRQHTTCQNTQNPNASILHSELSRNDEFFTHTIALGGDQAG
jgi:hypothetical protein